MPGRYGLIFVCVLATASPTQQVYAADIAERHEGTLTRYCVTCHNDALRTANLSLQHVAFDDVTKDAATWEKVLRKLQARAMPPAGVPRPTDATYASIAAFVESELDQSARDFPHPGRPRLRRLNRTEYVNSIRELFGIQVDGAALLPPDDAMHGFDNIGSVLTLSPLLVERYVDAARKVRQKALGDPRVEARFDYYRLPDTLLQDLVKLHQLIRNSEFCQTLGDLISSREIKAFEKRVNALASTGQFPQTRMGRNVPFPPI